MSVSAICSRCFSVKTQTQQRISLQPTLSSSIQVVYSPSGVLHGPFPLPLCSPSLKLFCCPSLILLAFSLSRAFVRPSMLDNFSILLFHLQSKSKCHTRSSSELPSKKFTPIEQATENQDVTLANPNRKSHTFFFSFTTDTFNMFRCT